jgi:phosphoribosylformylglycinamidine cyclo-ligase
VDRATWTPDPVFTVLAGLGGFPLTEAEGTWNLGIGMLAVVDPDGAEALRSALTGSGLPCWTVGEVRSDPAPDGAFERGAKGVDGGAVRLTGAWRP